ncbi:hypothetical protein N0V90_007327 [Kalmusia sp. IMI 367209]|nr:hypothetical protein N0V90_007327 [Kalmusia sp. IMI 367209]
MLLHSGSATERTKATAATTSTGPPGILHVITHECLEGDALRCVIKAVPDDVALELDDYIRAGDLLKWFEAVPLPHPLDLLPAPPPPSSIMPAVSFVGSSTQSSSTTTVVPTTITLAGDSTTITTTWTVPPQSSATTPTGPFSAPSASFSSVSAESSSAYVPSSGFTTVVQTTTACTNCAVLNKTFVSPIASSPSSSPVVTTLTPVSGPPFTTTLFTAHISSASQTTAKPDTALSGTLIPPTSTVRRPPGGWPFQSPASKFAFSRPNGVPSDAFRPTSVTSSTLTATGGPSSHPTVPTAFAGGFPVSSVAVAVGTSRTAFAGGPPVSIASALPSKITFGGPSGIFGIPSRPAPTLSVPTQAIATHAALRLLADVGRGPRVSDTTSEKRSTTGPRHLAKRDRDIKLDPHNARIMLEDEQTLNPNSKLLKKLHAKHSIAAPVELEERGIDRQIISAQHFSLDDGQILKRTSHALRRDATIGLLVVIMLMLATVLVSVTVALIKRRRAKHTARY